MKDFSMFSTKLLSKDLAKDLDNARRGALDNSRQLEQCRAAETMYTCRIARLQQELDAALEREKVKHLPPPRAVRGAPIASPAHTADTDPLMTNPPSARP